MAIGVTLPSSMSDDMSFSTRSKPSTSRYDSVDAAGLNEASTPSGRGRQAEKQPRISRRAQSQEELDDWRSPSDRYFDPPTPCYGAQSDGPSRFGPQEAPWASAGGCVPAGPVVGGSPVSLGARTPTNLSSQATAFVPMGAVAASPSAPAEQAPLASWDFQGSPQGAWQAPRGQAQQATSRWPGGGDTGTAVAGSAGNRGRAGGCGDRRQGRKSAANKPSNFRLQEDDTPSAAQRPSSPACSSTTAESQQAPTPAAVYVDLSCLKERPQGGAARPP